MLFAGTLTHETTELGRHDIRYRIAMPVEVRQGATWTPFSSEDVSLGGLYLRTKEPPSLRQLVRLRSHLPYELGAFEANAVVTRRNLAEGQPEQVAGMGVAFFLLAGEQRERWDSFIVAAAANCQALAETPFEARKISGARPAFAASDTPLLEVSLGRIEDLFVLHSRDASRAGLFLATPPGYSPSQRIALCVTHAPSKSALWIPCVVKQLRARGIAVEFARDEPKLLREFHDHLAQLIDAAERVAEGE